MMILRSALLLILLSSCQVLPTKTRTESTPQEGRAAVKADFQSLLKKNPVILDTRSPLDFSVSHAPGAINVNWQDFTKPERGQRGILLDDHLSLARRLSLWGIDPATPVIVVGLGGRGEGEEGRVAWMLKFLGVEEVQFGDWGLVRSSIPREDAGPQNKPIWVPKVKSDWAADFQEFKNEVLSTPRPTSKARAQAIQVPPAALERRNLVLDVTAFQRKENVLDKVKVPVRKIFWKDFIDDQGLPDPQIIKDLEKNGISKGHTIYVISENGVSSGLVTFILREWGYKAKNFMGGFEYLYQVQR